ncbi:transketolase family protein [Tessaracoccus palaemonis]|uniref:Transketolase family protein n=1 Tax=Tessaracoccus palaemonis TaxID=2829499 RepID=A0ABX8SJJ9_9ACTN|nr:transketolase C-terminal domain-containing protein [Tessaracoccus palaemonis]QXT62610.1 transketolase family protein [Tessaracoccus palaemonis]
MTETLYDCRDAWAETLAELAREDERVVAVVNDSVGSSKLGAFQQEFPARTVNVGIAEQDMVGVAAGLANGGKIPFVSAAGCFLTARAMEQIKADVAYSQYNVKLIGQSPGVSYGDLGPTHHSIEDFAWMRTLPGLVVLAPSDPQETEQALRWAAAHEGPVYIRIARMGVPAVTPEGYAFAPGRAVRLRDGDDVALIATGVTVARALAAAEVLAAEGIAARVISMPSVKPLDREAVLAAARETRGIVTVEEALVTGLGGAVAELVSAEQPTRVLSAGFHDQFANTGAAGWLLDHHGINAEGISGLARRIARAQA